MKKLLFALLFLPLLAQAQNTSRLGKTTLDTVKSNSRIYLTGANYINGYTASADGNLQYQAKASAYTFTLKNNSFNADTAFDGVDAIELGDYIYTFGYWNPNYDPTVMSIILKFKKSNLALPPVKIYAPYLARHGTMTFKRGDTVYFAGSDLQLAEKQLDAWAIYQTDDTGSLGFLQTTTFARGCNYAFTEGAYNPDDGKYYYGGGQLLVNFGSGTSDSLFSTKDFRTSEYVGRFSCLAGNIIGTLQFFNGKLHQIGGGLYHTTLGSRTNYKTHYVIDVVPKTQTQLPDYPGVAVQYPTTTVGNGLLYVYGGGDVAGANTSGLYAFDVNGTWTTISNSTLPATHASSLVWYQDTLQQWHMARIAGNFDDEIWDVTVSQGVILSNTAATLSSLVLSGNLTAAKALISDTARATWFAPYSGNNLYFYAPNGSVNALTNNLVITNSAGSIEIAPSAAENFVISKKADGTPNPVNLNAKLKVATAGATNGPGPTVDINYVGDTTVRERTGTTSYYYMHKLYGTSMNIIQYAVNAAYGAVGFAAAYGESGLMTNCYFDASGNVRVSRTNSDGAVCIKPSVNGKKGLLVYAKEGSVTAGEQLDVDANIVCWIDGSKDYHVYRNLSLETLGGKVKIKSGTNGTLGTAVLVGGTVTVANTSVTSASKIICTVQTPGGTQGHLSTAISNGVSFTITSTSASETSTVAWWIVDTQ